MASFQTKKAHLAFTASDTKTIAPENAQSALKILYLEIYYPADRILEVKVGSHYVAGGTAGQIAKESSPVVLNFPGGGGSGVLGDSITVFLNGTGEVYIGYREVSN